MPSRVIGSEQAYLFRELVVGRPPQAIQTITAERGLDGPNGKGCGRGDLLRQLEST